MVLVPSGSFWEFMYTEYTSWSVPQHTSSREHTLRTPWLKIKVVSASFIVIPHAHSHPVSLMSLLNVKFTPFPSLLSSPSASSSRASRHYRAAQEVGVNLQTHPLAGGSLAAWSIPLQAKVMSPSSPTSPITRNPEHNPIDIPDNNPDFRCSDDVTMISGSVRGMPKSEASGSSRRAPASKVSSLLGHTSSRET